MQERVRNLSLFFEFTCDVLHGTAVDEIEFYIITCTEQSAIVGVIQYHTCNDIYRHNIQSNMHNSSLRKAKQTKINTSNSENG